LSREFLRAYGDDVFRYFAPYRRPPMAKADIYGALLQADEYSEAARAALRAGADDAARDAIEVMLAIGDVVIEQLRKPSENRVLQ
jgi:hypothetical protein